MQISTKVAGIPCLVEVTAYPVGMQYCADSDWDYYGSGWEWEVQDRNGRAAPWLAAKMTDKDEARICRELDHAALEYAV